jgi:hypothetical protein
MNNSISISIFCCALLNALWFVGCGKSVSQLDTGWAPPVAVSSSIGSLGGWVDLYKCRDTIVGINVLRDGSPEGLILNPDHKSWSMLSFAGAPNGYVWGYSVIDPLNQNILSAKGYAENEQIMMKAFLGKTTDSGLQKLHEAQWITAKKTLLGETDEDIKLNSGSANREDIGLGVGLLSSQEVYIPFSIEASKVTQQGKSIVVDSTKGPFVNGVFHSADFGKTWQIEKISDHRAIAPELRKTTGHVYYFAGIYPLWSSRKAVAAEKWDEPQSITETFSMQGWYATAAEGDTVHVCWMDRRHNKWRFNIDGPPIENDDIYYCHRNEGDSHWTKGILLSKGLEYCYPPSISAEGQNVVVVWAGIASPDKHHSEYKPNNIYYVTSKNGGETWTKPVKITDKAKDGIVSGRPKVVLLNGTIHLFYTQGELEKAKELSPGLTRLNDQPWPIYYTQRPFPD